jgi:hypothetical protein
MRYTIPTIQHTGTKLLANMFEGFKRISFIEESEADNVLYLGHLTVNSIDNIKKLKNPIILPMRHPYLVAESWKRREKPLSDLVINFRLLINDIDKLDAMYLPIDVENKQDYLDEINEKLGLSLYSDWNVVNSKKQTYNLSYKELTPDPEMEDLVSDNKEFFERFYL